MDTQTSLLIFLGGWLAGNHNLSGIINILGWGVSHPVWGIAIAFFGLVLIFSTVKLVAQGLESVGMAILKTPLRLVWEVVKVVFNWLGKGLFFVWRKIRKQDLVELEHQQKAIDLQNLRLKNQQRLTEISQRLTEIQQEQSELIQEAASLIEAINQDKPQLNQLTLSGTIEELNNTN